MKRVKREFGTDLRIWEIELTKSNQHPSPSPNEPTHVSSMQLHLLAVYY